MSTMSTKPIKPKFLDREEEEELYRAIESDAYDFSKSTLTPQRKAELQKAARYTLNDERVQITLRVSKHNLSKLKAKAILEGMPYQTLINSILHKSVN
jgi:predicted DNA binding CopG/RHH family protein